MARYSQRFAFQPNLEYVSTHESQLAFKGEICYQETNTTFQATIYVIYSSVELFYSSAMQRAITRFVSIRDIFSIRSETKLKSNE